MKKINIKYIVLVIFTSALIACNSSNKSLENNVSIKTESAHELVDISFEQFNDSQMKLGAVTTQRFSEGIKTNGYIDVPPANKAQVSAIMGGYIKESSLLIGDQVKKGQRLLTIENPDFIEIQQEYLEINETLKYLKSDFERQKMLFDEKITSEKKYLKAESEYKSSLAKFKGLEQKLMLLNVNLDNVLQGNLTAKITIYAPITGSISNVYTSVGKFMSASEVLVEIIDSSHKHLELVVFEKDVLSLKEGQVIEFQTPEKSKQIFNGEVHLIGKSIDEENRTVKVHGHIDNEDTPFLVGMFVEADIITTTVDKLVLPIEAILEDNNEIFILTLKNKNSDHYEFEKTPVKTGVSNKNWIEIIGLDNELKEKQILIKGAFIPLEEGAGGHSH